MTIRNRPPTVAEICEELARPTGEISHCRNVRDGNFYSWASPLEIYVETFGGWIRCDGSYAGFALNGTKYYGRHSRQRIARAIKDWQLNKLLEFEKLDWRAVRDIGTQHCDNGSGFAQILEMSWRQFTKQLQRMVR